MNFEFIYTDGNGRRLNARIESVDGARHTHRVILEAPACFSGHRMQEVGFIYGLTSANPAIKIGRPIGIRFVDALLNAIRSIALTEPEPHHRYH